MNFVSEHVAEHRYGEFWLPCPVTEMKDERAKAVSEQLVAYVVSCRALREEYEPAHAGWMRYSDVGQGRKALHAESGYPELDVPQSSPDEVVEDVIRQKSQLLQNLKDELEKQMESDKAWRERGQRMAEDDFLWSQCVQADRDLEKQEEDRLQRRREARIASQKKVVEAAKRKAKK